MTHYKVGKSFLSPSISYIDSLWVWDYNKSLHLQVKHRTKIIIELHEKKKKTTKKII